MRSCRPRHQVCDAGPDLVVATRAAVALDGLFPGHRSNQPVPVRAGLQLRATRPPHGWRWGSTAWKVASRHHHLLYGHPEINTVVAERHPPLFISHPTWRAPLWAWIWNLAAILSRYTALRDGYSAEC